MNLELVRIWNSHLISQTQILDVVRVFSEFKILDKKNFVL